VRDEPSRRGLAYHRSRDRLVVVSLDHARALRVTVPDVSRCMPPLLCRSSSVWVAGPSVSSRLQANSRSWRLTRQRVLCFVATCSVLRRLPAPVAPCCCAARVRGLEASRPDSREWPSEVDLPLPSMRRLHGAKPALTSLSEARVHRNGAWLTAGASRHPGSPQAPGKPMSSCGFCATSAPRARCRLPPRRGRGGTVKPLRPKPPVGTDQGLRWCAACPGGAVYACGNRL
jgi:hypothetical protein